MAWLTILISQQDLYCWDINLFITAFASSLFYSTTLRTANTELPWLFKDLAILRSATRDMSCRAQHLGDTSVCWPKHTRGLFPSSHKAEGHRTVPLVAVGAGQPTRPSVVSVHVFYLAQLLKQLFGHNGRWQMIQQRAHQGNTRRKSPSTHGTVLGLLWNTSIPSQVPLPSFWHPGTSPPHPCLDGTRLAICERVHQHSPQCSQSCYWKNNANLHSASGWSLESAARITENTAIKLTNLSTQTCIYPDFSRAMSMSKPGRPHRQILDAGITWDSSFHLFLQCTKIIRIGHGKTPPFFLCFQKQPNPFSQLLLLHCCFSFFNLITSSMNNFQHGKFLPKELKLA